MELAEIAHHPELAPLLARWHVAEWGHLYPQWDEAVAADEFLAMRQPGRIPTTWVAFAGAGRTPADVLGSVSLIDDDELDGYRHLRPWLASLYVVPAARGRGVGSALVAHVVAAARALDLARVHLFTEDGAGWYRALGWRTLEQVSVRGEAAEVMVIDTHPDAPRRAVASRWCTDPDVGGAYSSLQPGGTPADRARLARPPHPGLHLAGEYTSVDHPGTLHGAWFSGERAARAVLAGGSVGPGPTVVVGAGASGLAAARTLRDAGRPAVVLEASDRPGGRASTDRSLGGPVPLAAAWFHGHDGHPFVAAAEQLGHRFRTDLWEEQVTFVAGTGRLDAHDTAAARRVITAVERRIDRADDVAVGPVLRRALAAEVADRRVPPPVALAAERWLLAEYENLYATPVDSLSRAHRSEPFALPGEDRYVVGALDEVVDRLAAGLDVRCGVRATSIAATSDGWNVEEAGGAAHRAGAVILAVPLGVLHRGRLAVTPTFPDAVTASLQRLNAGLVAKTFLRFDRRWWTTPTFALAAADPAPRFTLWVDATDIAGFPCLGAFATGATVLAVELADEDTLCRWALADLVRCGALPPR
jgi:monoamine oxidase